VTATLGHAMTAIPTRDPVSRPGRNDACWCGSGRKYKRCHMGADRTAGRRLPVRPGILSPPRPVPESIPRPPYVTNGGQPPAPRAPARPRTPDELTRMRRAGATARAVLDVLQDHVKPGVTTDELDAIAHEEIIRRGAYPSPLGYHGFPKSICTSVNEVICHGIPDDRALRDGDIVNIDVTVFLDGVHGDTSLMYCAGDVGEEARRLIAVTQEALVAGVAAARPGAEVRMIGRAIEGVTKPHGYGVVRAFVGHGVGAEFHSEPVVHHYERSDARDLLQPGMTFTIEPMINVGTWEHEMWDDGWTAVTRDGSLSAQFEHTVAVTDRGVEILTLPEGADQPFLR
jgi:methionyl aminopeptidase